MTHTLHLKAHIRRDEEYASLILDQNDDIVADCSPFVTGKSDVEAGDNAALIVRAVNSLTALVKALERLVARYDHDNPMRTADFHQPECTCTRCAVDFARAALASHKTGG